MTSPIAHYKAILAYDGTNYAGFQKQAKVRTVQSELEAALVKLGWNGRSLLAAGRTDTGVHASGQVIAFSLSWNRTLPTLLNALNANLPADIAVRHLELAPEGFRPRQDALARRYRYTLFYHPVRHPLLERYAWRIWPEPDLTLLEQTAERLLGIHDFQAFGTPPLPGGVTIRQVFTSTWQRDLIEPDSIPRFVYEIEANAFLFHMVRRIVQLQVTIAQKRLPLDIIAQYLTNQNPDPVMGLAPPQGLNLCAVRYSDPEV